MDGGDGRSHRHPSLACLGRRPFPAGGVYACDHGGGGRGGGSLRSQDAGSQTDEGVGSGGSAPGDYAFSASHSGTPRGTPAPAGVHPLSRHNYSAPCDAVASLAAPGEYQQVPEGALAPCPLPPCASELDGR